MCLLMFHYQLTSGKFLYTGVGRRTECPLGTGRPGPSWRAAGQWHLASAESLKGTHGHPARTHTRISSHTTQAEKWTVQWLNLFGNHAENLSLSLCNCIYCVCMFALFVLTFCEFPLNSWLCRAMRSLNSNRTADLSHMSLEPLTRSRLAKVLQRD